MKMSKFTGFSEGKSNLVPLPEAFFTSVLSSIEHLGELKLTLYIFWRLSKMEAPFRFIRQNDLTQDTNLPGILNCQPDQIDQAIEQAVEDAVERGTFLKANLPNEEGNEILLFVNSPKGRAAVQAIQKGQWHLKGKTGQTLELIPERRNIFQLYEENFGPLTPLLSDVLGEAEDTYPADWIEEAFRIAVEKNKRNWRYVAAILERWQREGYHVRKENRKDRRGSAEDRQRYVEGEYSEFIEH